MVIDESDGADALIVNSKISKINDLKGKKIAYTQNSISNFFVDWLLYITGIKINEVTMVPCADINEAIDKFTSGQADAVCGWFPDIEKAIESGGKVLIGSDKLRVAVDVLLVSNKAITEKTNLVAGLHYAWFESLKYLFENPEKTEELIASSEYAEWAYVVNKGDLEASLATIAQAGLEANRLVMANHLDSQQRKTKGYLVERLDEAARVWLWSGKKFSTIDYSAVIDTRFVTQAAAVSALKTTARPVNNTFLMTGYSEVPKFTEAELGKAIVVAVSPLEKIAFKPDSYRLTDEAIAQLDQLILPWLRSSPNLYLRLDGSAAQPKGDTNTTTEDFARKRIDAVVQYLVSHGIDSNRFIVSWIPPKFPQSTKESDLEQDRFVRFTVIDVIGR